jgi:hypothetical protein
MSCAVTTPAAMSSAHTTSPRSIMTMHWTGHRTFPSRCIRQATSGLNWLQPVQFGLLRLVDMRGRIEPLVQSDYPLQPNHLQHYWLLTCLRTFQTHHHCPACCLGDVLQHPPTGLHALWTLLHCSLTCPIPRCLFPGSSLLRRPPMHCNTSRSQRTRRRCAPMPTSSRCKARSVQSWTASR